MQQILDADPHLVARVRQGDEAAFGLLARRYERWLVTTCARHLGGDHHLAEDVTQECLLKLHAALRRDERELSVQAWLAVVARHACIDQMRRRTPVPYEDLPERAVEPEDPFDLDPALATAWQLLAPRHREALTHRELVGLSYEEIALAMGTTVPAVETLLFRARASLRKHYLKAGGGLLGCGAYLFSLDRLGRGPAAETQVTSHVTSCGSCQDALAQTDRLSELLRGVAPLPPRGGGGRVTGLLIRLGEHTSTVLAPGATFGNQVGTALTAAAIALAPQALPAANGAAAAPVTRTVAAQAPTSSGLSVSARPLTRPTPAPIQPTTVQPSSGPTWRGTWWSPPPRSNPSARPRDWSPPEPSWTATPSSSPRPLWSWPPQQPESWPSPQHTPS